MIKKLFLVLSLLLVTTPVFAKDSVEDEGEKLLNKFMKALQIQNIDEAEKAILPYVYPSEISGKNLIPTVRQYSFKKAHKAAKGYKYPVVITRVRETRQTQVGFKETGGLGKVYDFFIDRKEDAGGRPAPVKIFFPKNGGDAKILYMGSL